MAQKKGYKRGITVFLIISIGTFALMFFFGNDNVKGASFSNMLLVEQNIGESKSALEAKKIVKGQMELDKRVIPVLIVNQTNYATFKKRLFSLKSNVATNLGRSLLIGNNAQYVNSYLTNNQIHNVLVLAIDTVKINLRLIDKTNGNLSLVEANLKLDQVGASGIELVKVVQKLFNKISYHEKKFNILESFLHIQPIYLLFALSLWLIAVLLDSYMVKYLLNVMHDDMSFKECLYSILGFEFLNAVTPFQSGGQPLMIYIMHRNKVPVGKGLLLAFLKTAGQIYFFALTAPIVMLVWPGIVSFGSLGPLYVYALLFFGYFLVLTFFVIFKPNLAKKIVFSFFKFLKKFKYFRKKNLGKALRKTIKEISIFTFYISMIVKEKKFTFIWIFLITGFSWVVKFMIAVAVIWGLGGFAVNVLQALSVQTVTNFIAYFAPSPGGSGVVEFSMQKMFENVLTNGEIVFAFVVIWRFISYYISVFLGGLLIVKILKINHDTLDEEEDQIEDLEVPGIE